VPGLELIAQTGNHAYHVDVAAATKAGVLICMGSSDMAAMTDITASTVELTFGLMLALLRHIPEGDRAIRSGEWPGPLGRTLKGKRLGILGLGRIGREVARISQAFGMEVLAWGPTLTDQRAAEAGVQRLELDALLEASDIVSVHLKSSDQSRNLLDEARLRRLGPKSFLVNTARGAIVDEMALAKVLEQRALGGAALDVFTSEPLPAGSPLRNLDNVVLAPHLGWPADLTYRTMAEAVVQIVEAYMAGSHERAVNPEALEHRAEK
jgi:phosphoglycerate dehydrogenase-like enzyme